MGVACRSAVVIAGMLFAAPALLAQSFGIAAGPMMESRRNTGGVVQLSYTSPTGVPRLGLRVDAIFAQQPGVVVHELVGGDGMVSFRDRADQTYALTGGLSYHFTSSGAIRPYALLGGGFYSRNSYTSGYSLGANAGVGADLRLGRMQLFTEGRLHQFHGGTQPWTDDRRFRLVPITLGIRF
jgi:hypothetical protein